MDGGFNLRRRGCGVLFAAGLLPVWVQAEPAPVETERFEIRRFEIRGNRLLPTEQLQALIAPLTGSQREYGDIQRALEAVELAYRSRGYAAVQVYAPEQELTGGTVRLEVTETVVGKIRREGAAHHIDADNLQAAIPALREGVSPNAFDLSAQIALNNENPAKQVEVVLGLGETDGQIDATLKVTENDPLRFSVSLDNTGTSQTGRHRIGFALQHANLWNRDHVASLAYQTSPEKPDQVSIYSLSYRLPVYAWAGAFDFILARSSVDAGITTTTAGNLAFAGSGDVLGLRYTHTLPRQGDVSEKLVLGWDLKATDNTCRLGGFGAAGCGAAAQDVTLRPLSATYQRTQFGPGRATDFGLGLSVNLPGGRNGTDREFQAARPGLVAGSTGARAHYEVVRANFSHFHLLPGDWQLRLAGQAQWADQALLSQEQIGLAGNAAVRGFGEREVARDTGAFVNLEAYTPNLAETAGLTGSTLRALAFLDAGSGRNRLLAGETQPESDLASWGFGFRYSQGKDIAAKLDVAQILTSNGARSKGDWLGHFSLNLSF